MMFRLSHACHAACRDLPMQFEEMRTAIANLYQHHDVQPSIRLDLECRLFLYWSMEIGLINAQGNRFDRWRATRCFERSLRQMPIHLKHGVLPYGAGMDDIYRQRYREVLPKIRNVYVRRWSNGSIELPLTPRVSNLFLCYTAEPLAMRTSGLSNTLHSILRSICETQVMQILNDRQRQRVIKLN
ncbi:hypothetical protein [Sphingobium aquiterrae]|uniref:hypothetical protein n=1 Tax=Sphingobium aquiterrae TaxID=2038656 RepID=UPI0030192E6A